MTAMTNDQDNKNSNTSMWIGIATGAFLGFFGFRFGRDILSSDGDSAGLLELISISQLAALAVAFILLFCVVIVVIGFAFPRLGLKMEMFEDLEQWEEERTMMGLSAFGGAAYGAIVVLLALAETFDLTRSFVALGAIGLLALVCAYTAWRLLKEYDELWTEVNSETCTYAMYLMLIVGGLWSIAAHLDFIPALTALDVVTLLTAASLVGALISTKKRGMLED